MSSPLEFVNANHILLPPSPAATVKVTESRTDTNLKPPMVADATSGKEKLCVTMSPDFSNKQLFRLLVPSV